MQTVGSSGRLNIEIIPRLRLVQKSQYEEVELHYDNEMHSKQVDMSRVAAVLACVRLCHGS